MTFAEARLRVVGIGGTLRDGSTNLGALPRALAASEEAGAAVELLDLGELELPMYEPRRPLDEYGDNVRRLIEALREADELIISTAAYHGKVVGLISTAGGEQALRGIVAPLMVGVTKAWRRTDDNYGGLVVELAQKLQAQDPSRRAEPVGAVA